MDKHTLKFGSLYTDILKETGKVSEKDCKTLDKAKAVYASQPTDENATNLCNIMQEIAKKS